MNLRGGCPAPHLSWRDFCLGGLVSKLVKHKRPGFLSSTSTRGMAANRDYTYLQKDLGSPNVGEAGACFSLHLSGLIKLPWLPLLNPTSSFGLSGRDGEVLRHQAASITSQAKALHIPKTSFHCRKPNHRGEEAKGALFSPSLPAWLNFLSVLNAVLWGGERWGKRRERQEGNQLRTELLWFS